MSVLNGWSQEGIARRISVGFFVAGIAFLLCAVPMLAESPGQPATPAASAVADRVQTPIAPCQAATLGSPYIPVDSWMYTSLTRLYSLGYLDLAFLGLRPWTRTSVIHMLEDTAAQLEDAPEGRRLTRPANSMTPCGMS